MLFESAAGLAVVSTRTERGANRHTACPLRFQHKYQMQNSTNTENDSVWSYRITTEPEAIWSHPNPSERLYAVAIRQGGQTIINQFLNRGLIPSENLQMLMVKTAGFIIKQLLDAGIVPSEQVQLAAVSQPHHAISYLVRAGIKPSEAVQMAAVKEHPASISYLIKAGIKPSEAVQLAAVEELGWSLKYLVQGGITPSNTVKKTALIKYPPAMVHLTPEQIPWQDRDFKTTVIKRILVDIKQGTVDQETTELLELLDEKHCPWEELAVLNRAMNSSY